MVRLAQAGRHSARSVGATRAGAEERALQWRSEPHLLCGLRAHMLGTHTATCACVYIYTDIHERDYYRYRFTYTVNTSNYCGILKAAESAPHSRKCFSLSLSSELCLWLGWWMPRARAPAGEGAGGKQGHPSPAPCTVPQEGPKHLPWPCTNPTASRDPGGTPAQTQPASMDKMSELLDC